MFSAQYPHVNKSTINIIYHKCLRFDNFPFHLRITSIIFLLSFFLYFLSMYLTSYVSGVVDWCPSCLHCVPDLQAVSYQIIYKEFHICVLYCLAKSEVSIHMTGITRLWVELGLIYGCSFEMHSSCLK